MRTVLVRAAPKLPWPRGKGACEFCVSLTLGGVRHDLCPGEILNAGGKPGSKWTCDCHAAGHNVEATIEAPIGR